MTAKTAKLHLDYRHAACERLTADTDATLNDDATENYFRLAHPGLEDYDLEDIEGWIVLGMTPTQTALTLVDPDIEETAKPSITIYRDDVWSGTGRIDSEGQIVDCAAVLGPNQEASDETYEAIEAAITEEPQDDGRYSGSGEITRPDGVYSWEITD